jgi:hypothetical protein
MKITISKSQWKEIGQKTGWIKSSQENIEPNIAQTILQQLGGHRFVVMTGAKNLSDTGNGLSFRLPGSGGFTKNGINYVKITLDPSDTYSMEFGKIRGTTYKIIHSTNDIYEDQLQEVFQRETGLSTKL